KGFLRRVVIEISQQAAVEASGFFARLGGGFLKSNRTFQPEPQCRADILDDHLEVLSAYVRLGLPDDRRERSTEPGRVAKVVGDLLGDGRRQREALPFARRLGNERLPFRFCKPDVIMTRFVFHPGAIVLREVVSLPSETAVAVGMQDRLMDLQDQ